MAVSLSPSPILPLLTKPPSSSSSSSSTSSLRFPVVAPRSYPRRRRQQPPVVSAVDDNGLTSEEATILRERYGFDPSQIIDKRSALPRQARIRGKRSKELRDKPGTGEANPDVAEAKTKRTTHRLLQVLGGTAKRKKLLSPKGMDVRPMMEVVKGSAFDILQSADGSNSSLRPGRWLDLYSGTGSVGIEAISRGCSEVHFVEMDPWVVSNVLRPNLETTGFLDVSVIHTVTVESFLKRAEKLVGGMIFDFISVTPPYTQVDYEILMDQISKSNIIGEDSFILVEYPLRTVMLDTCGCLFKLTDRRFGRTHLAIYGPKWAQKRRKSEASLNMVA